MILVIGGTSDGRRLAEYLTGRERRVVVSVTGTLGAGFLQGLGVDIVQGRFSRDTLKQLLASKKIKLVVDASHPFAVEVSRLAQAVCKETGIIYLRYERRASELPEHPLVIPVATWDQASRAACARPGTAFLTVGVKPLPRLYRAGLMEQKRVVARVLPLESSLQACKKYRVAEVVAFCGVAGKELNLALYRHFQTGVVLTKDSGAAGGTGSKIDAALALNLPVIIIKRPAIRYQHQADTFDEVEQFIKECGLS